ncbi:uncharacterized protein LOC124540291 [Vanessa cardui]|uniref:uncharacterized protein LOC124540291 n=1 Tax=Vanessa cardui TaxID=171605 RepID=UPI001F132440|nr:uncharacterized protein LOC124540291 [Vanessa cardui]
MANIDVKIILLLFYMINTSKSVTLKVNNLLDRLSAPDGNEIAFKDIDSYKTRRHTNHEDYKQNIQKPERLLNNHYNKLLIKRIIPHGMKPSGLEYDTKFKTYYKPLIRIHKEKQNKYSEDNNRNDIAFIVSNNPKLKHFELKNIKYDKDSVLLEPFKLSTSEMSGSEFDVIKNLENIIKSIESRTQRIKAYDKVIKLLKNMLRSPQFEKSGEVNDPFAPGKVMSVDRDTATEKNKVWMPHYPPWNYWTYKKNLHQDVCPGEQVKLGNICIWTPPH